jgi:hypothetical protein
MQADATLRTLEIEGERLVVPRFDGFGLANVAPTVLAILGGPAVDLPLPRLDARVLPSRMTDGVRTVVVVAADGLGHLQLEREAAAGNAPGLRRLLDRAAAGDEGVSYQAITSVFPTTTVAALGSLNSAVRPVDHGLLGYTLYVPELAMVAEMIRWGPLDRRVSFSDPEFGLTPEGFFWADTLYRRLQAAGVQRTLAVNPSGFAGTALTRMLHQGATYNGYVATSSLSVIVPRLVADSDAPTYVYAYWPTVDTVSHMVGPCSEEHGAEVAAFDTALGRLLERLPRRGDTLVLLTADHGHIDTGPERLQYLDEHPELLEMLAATPAGERRAVYLHPRPGMARAVEAYTRERLGQVAVTMTRDAAVRAGLFGEGPLPERAAGRIGEVLLFPRGNLQITVAPTPSVDGRVSSGPLFKGLHGGLSPDEALVPLLAVRI